MDTSPGPHVLHVAASDVVGNESSVSVPYTVVAAVTGKIVDASTGSGSGWGAGAVLSAWLVDDDGVGDDWCGRHVFDGGVAAGFL